MCISKKHPTGINFIGVLPLSISQSYLYLWLGRLNIKVSKVDLELGILYACIAAGIGLAGYKLYKRLMADGKITLDELVDLAEDLQDVAKSLPSLSELKKLKKDDLISLCKENGLEVKGTKAELISRLQEIEGVVN